jgi:ABC-type transport system involved in multi-copper enzyme maturation permease subunit
MIRFAWLQARTQSMVVGAILVALAITTAITGVQLAHLYSSLVAPCKSGCDLAQNDFLSHDGFLQNALVLLMRIAPGVIGIFWGAPLLTRELESGTFRLVWTQSVSRTRWLLTKLAVVGLASVAVSGLLTLMVTWWFRAIDLVSLGQYGTFDMRDVAPIGYGAFAFAVGALLGAVIRRTLPAMAATLGVFVFARVAVTLWVRPNLLTPRHVSTSLLGADQFGFMIRNGGSPVLVAKGSAGPNSWPLSSHFATSSGHVATSRELSAFVQQFCPQVAQPPIPAPGQHAIVKGPGVDAMLGCRTAAAHTYHLVVSYIPAGRYWTLQWLELGIFLGLAALALAGCFYWVTRRTN